ASQTRARLVVIVIIVSAHETPGSPGKRSRKPSVSGNGMYLQWVTAVSKCSVSGQDRSPLPPLIAKRLASRQS
ncbi:MAG: hypothetical protein L0241_12660, partial [Planctomycetia bacterium]|nr:hypothetical protein [Planctomycetia bacterium]